MTATARRVSLTLAVLLLASAPALAHHPMGGTTPETLTQGLLSGLGHPILGLDHVAALIGAGLLASRFAAGGWLVPGFVLAMVAGALVHMAGIAVPAGEVLVAASVILVGAAAALRPRMPVGLAAALFAAAGLVHGHALAEAIIGAETTPLIAYLLGLVTIQTALAGGVLLLARWLASGALAPTPRLRLAGVAVASFGLGALALAVAGL